ncbi:MAG: inositol monophosphatase [Paenibacillaceae bacterium]|jgi:myo-inositol-1(or 4)-monophosphatase|nr:inositol monophosphatase [Paenibacillaceae bacterium]
MNAKQMMNDLEEWMKQVADLQRNGRQRQLDILAKEHEMDFVTDVDMASEEMLITFIGEKYPGHSILTEERGFIDKGSDYLWVIDPIDGTTNYIHGFPMSSISVGLRYKGLTQAGMVHAPWLAMTFKAIRGQGAYLNGERIQVSRTDQLQHSLLGTGFPAGGNLPIVNLAYFEKMLGKVSGIRRTGSAALDLCFVAASFLDGYWEFDLKEWDMCAGAFIAEEAGGKVLQLDMSRHSLLICGNPFLTDILHDHLLEHNYK